MDIECNASFFSTVKRIIHGFFIKYQAKLIYFLHFAAEVEPPLQMHIPRRKPKSYHLPPLGKLYILMSEKRLIMKVNGDIIPCQTPIQNPGAPGTPGG